MLSIEKRAFKGFMNLSILKGIDYIIPLAVIPYCIHILGLDFYGYYAYVQTFAIFLAFICDYSFPITAVQGIAKRKKHKYKNHYVSSIFFLKLILVFLVSSLAFLIVNVFIDDTGSFFIAGIFIYIGLATQNLWYYQAMEIYKPIIFFSLLSRVACFILMFIFVRDSDDILNFLLIISLMYFFPGFLSFCYILRTVKLEKPQKKYLVRILQQGSYIFQYRFINASVLPYTNQMIYTSADATALALYNLTMKALSALVNLLTPMSLSVLPLFSELKNSRDSSKLPLYFMRTRNKVLYLSLIMSFVLIISIIFYFNFYGNLENRFGPYLLVLFVGLTLVPHALNSLYSQTLNLYGESKFVRNSILFYILFSFPLMLISSIYLPFYMVGLVSLLMYYSILITISKRLKFD